MDKGYIFMSIPKKCKDCFCAGRHTGRFLGPGDIVLRTFYFCAARFFDTGDIDECSVDLTGVKPDWCPIKPDVISDSLRELIEEYGEDGTFSVNGKEISAKDLLKELKIDSKIGAEFRKDITKTIISYFMKFKGEA